MHAYAAHQVQKRQPQEALPLVITRACCPHPLHPIFSKYAWAKDGNTWKGALLPEYHQNLEIMPMPQIPAQQG